MKKIYCFFVFVILSVAVNAETVSSEMAQRAAYNFVINRIDESFKSNFELILYKEVYNRNRDKSLYYIFNMSPEGFIIMSADDNLVPVIAFSFEGTYKEGVNPSQEAMLNFQVESAMQNVVSDLNNNYKWQNLSKNPAMKPAKDVPQLITTRWNQDIHYNYMCPVDSNGPGYRAYAGCVATAMGQVMKYWNHPINGEGGYAYQHIWPMYFSNYGIVQANFGGTTYNWSNMPNQINASNRIDVATLLFHCGVSVKMDYGPNGSGAKTEKVPFALYHYFKYDDSADYIERSFMSSQKWDSIIISQLEKGFPMVYSGRTTTEGHAWVIDGYQDSAYFHVNWGWGGWNNGFFYLSDLNSGNGDFTNYQTAVINIFPRDYVGISEPHNNSEIMVYPNPSSSYLNVEGISGDFQINIYNMQGQLINHAVNEYAINLNSFSNGTYFINIQNDKINITKSFVVLK
ncbi:MAG: C10 family peptidase [Bacteroidales bacterium]|nr:C10 family peptidase [Bacteroidales bacterium]